MKVFIVPNVARKNTQAVLDSLIEELKRYNISYYIPDYSRFKNDDFIRKFYTELISDTKKNTQAVLDSLIEELKRYNISYYIPDYSRFKNDDFIRKFYTELISDTNCKDTLELASSDVLIPMGGDGTIVRCAGLAAHYKIPILGINSGTLGFLAELEKNAIKEGITRLYNGDYTISYRSTLKSFATVNGKSFSELVINEITITKPMDINVIDLSISCDGRYVDRFFSDGLLFSTATGSTAYALAAGGSVIDPRLSVINMVAICPHDIGIKPISFSADRTLCISSSNSPLVIIPDGKERIEIPMGEKVYITGGETDIGFISFGNKEFFEILSEKLKHKK